MAIMFSAPVRRNALPRRPLAALLAGFLAAGLFLGAVPHARGQADPSGNSRVLAPELNGGAEWLGTDKPITLKELRGKVVVLDFWTLC
jgi:hypothetical protein